MDGANVDCDVEQVLMMMEKHLRITGKKNQASRAQMRSTLFHIFFSFSSLLHPSLFL